MKIEKDFQKLRKLNQNFAQQQRCTGALLKAMRLVEFHSIVIREYGFIVANQLLCTTTLGILKKPILQSPNDIQAIDSDVQFARSAPIATLEEKEFGMRTRIGHFQAFIRHIPLVG
ncbi:MAG: CSS-motif domain-containing protein [Gammaproteobacteria bacterium]|nr:CSS-motif domain-containing protein [Gammaproteobacteria bacterium]